MKQDIPIPSASGTDIYTVSFNPTLTAYVTNQVYYVRFVNANTGAATLNVDGLGVKSLVKSGGAALASSDIFDNEIVEITYDGTDFQVIGLGSQTLWGAITGTLSNQTDLQTVLNGKQATITDIIWGAIIAAFTAKTTIVDADLSSIGDSADSGNAKKVTWLNIWLNYIKVKADAVYTTTGAVATQITTALSSYLTSATAASTYETIANVALKEDIVAATESLATTGTVTLDFDKKRASAITLTGNVTFALGTSNLGVPKLIRITPNGFTFAFTSVFKVTGTSMAGVVNSVYFLSFDGSTVEVDITQRT